MTCSGDSIWEDPISDHDQVRATEEETVSRISGRYLDLARQYCAASGAVKPGTLLRLRDDPSGSGEDPRRHQAEQEAADVGEEGHAAAVGRGAEQPEVGLDELVQEPQAEEDPGCGPSCRAGTWR